MRHALRLAGPLALVFALALTGAARAEPVPMTADEFKLWKEYQGALSDERVQKIPEAKRLAAIAKNFKVTDKVLQAAIDKGAQHGEGAKAKSEAEAKALLEAGPIKGRVDSLEVNTEQPLVVSFVSWKNQDSAKLEEEAAYVALAVAKGAPITNTIALWAIDAASGRKVFEAKIGGVAASRFNQDRIPMFSPRYIKVFDSVKNAYKGTPPTEDAPAPAAAAPAFPAPKGTN